MFTEANNALSVGSKIKDTLKLRNSATLLQDNHQMNSAKKVLHSDWPLAIIAADKDSKTFISQAKVDWSPPEHRKYLNMSGNETILVTDMNDSKKIIQIPIFQGNTAFHISIRSMLREFHNPLAKITSIWQAQRWRCCSCRGLLVFDSYSLCSQCKTTHMIPSLPRFRLTEKECIVAEIDHLGTVRCASETSRAGYVLLDFASHKASSMSSMVEVNHYCLEPQLWAYASFESWSMRWRQTCIEIQRYHHFLDSFESKECEIPKMHRTNTLLEDIHGHCCRLFDYEANSSMIGDAIEAAIGLEAAFLFGRLLKPHVGVNFTVKDASDWGQFYEFSLSQITHWKRCRAFEMRAEENFFMAKKILHGQTILATRTVKQHQHQRRRHCHFCQPSMWLNHKQSEGMLWRVARSANGIDVLLHEHDAVHNKVEDLNRILIKSALVDGSVSQTFCYQQQHQWPSISLFGLAKGTLVVEAVKIRLSATKVQKVWRGARQRRLWQYRFDDWLYSEKQSFSIERPRSEYKRRQHHFRIAAITLQSIFRGVKVRRTMIKALGGTSFIDPELDVLLEKGDNIMGRENGFVAQSSVASFVDTAIWRQRREEIRQKARKDVLQSPFNSQNRAAMSIGAQLNQDMGLVVNRQVSPLVVQRVRQHQQLAQELNFPPTSRYDTEDDYDYSAYDRLGPSVSRPSSSTYTNSEVSAVSSGHWKIEADEGLEALRYASSGTCRKPTPPSLAKNQMHKPRQHTIKISSWGNSGSRVSRDRARHHVNRGQKKKRPAWAMPAIE